MISTKYRAAKAQKEPSAPILIICATIKRQKVGRDCHLEPHTQIKWCKHFGDFSFQSGLIFVCARASFNVSQCVAYSCLLMWSSLWIITWILVIYANFNLFIKCLLLSIWLFSLFCSVFIFCLCCVCVSVSRFIPMLLGQPFVYVFLGPDCLIRGLDLCRLALNHLYWLWFVWRMLLLRHPGVSHQLHKREFTAHLNLFHT